MTILRAQVSFLRDSGIPEDVVINTWHFTSIAPATPLEAAGEAFTMLETLYQVIDFAMAAYIASPGTVQFYDLADAPPRVPILEDTFTIAPGTGIAFPAEVAIAMSYRGDLVSGTNPARRRGRIYLGPIDESASTTDSSDVRVEAGARATIAGALLGMMETGFGASAARWVVFSPTEAGPGPWTESQVESASVDVTSCYIDNAFDTIRSRGSRATARSVASVTIP